jgi:hypothetical protein
MGIGGMMPGLSGSRGSSAGTSGGSGLNGIGSSGRGIGGSGLMIAIVCPLRGKPLATSPVPQLREANSRLTGGVSAAKGTSGCLPWL